MTESITVNLYLASFYYINPLLAGWLEESLIGSIKCLLQFACHISLHVLGPPAQEEDASLDNRERLLIDNHTS